MGAGVTWDEPRPKVKDFVVWNDTQWVSRWIRKVPKTCQRCKGEILPSTIAYRRLKNYPPSQRSDLICGKCANEIGRSNS